MLNQQNSSHQQQTDKMFQQSGRTFEGNKPVVMLALVSVSMLCICRGNCFLWNKICLSSPVRRRNAFSLRGAGIMTSCYILFPALGRIFHRIRIYRPSSHTLWLNIRISVNHYYSGPTLIVLSQILSLLRIKCTNNLCKFLDLSWKWFALFNYNATSLK